ncbi:TRAFs-binding domain-containing protein [Rhizobium mayense]|uniref:TRAFs-binding domain-containing protein n=1 Tax=Rhizobium mayense TaxID=1312184 RepID=A0ABT7K3C5_9HYPH|nr:TRAFs-binding domain-containing protein [Rhizobium mayense]MDL2403087.1 TRAFs-binding domain-containing protein [Rhizobium mayense]
MARKPLCFVLMPFGTKSAGGEKPINFDAVYDEFIKPAIEEAGLDPIRADEEQAGGIIHKPMFERLVLCEYAIADLTTANANVFYELGVRHAAKPRTTVLLFAKDQGRLPFDVAPLRAMPYSIGASGGPIDKTKSIEALVARLKAARTAVDKDSPLFQLIDEYPETKIAHEKTDIFREQVAYGEELKTKLRAARKEGRDAVYAIEESLGSLEDEEAGVIVDLFISYRSLEAWADMVRMFSKVDATLRNTILLREQYALAFNRNGDGEEAQKILEQLIHERGPSSETYGILGRVYKDRWLKAKEEGKTGKAKGHLRQAIETYLKGFEADWRDAYPGINALTLIHAQDHADPRIPELRSVVEYAVRRKIASGISDYWDYASLLELAVLAKDPVSSETHLGDALSHIREGWEPKTTAKNLSVLLEALPADSNDRRWIENIINELLGT